MCTNDFYVTGKRNLFSFEISIDYNFYKFLFILQIKLHTVTPLLLLGFPDPFQGLFPDVYSFCLICISLTNLGNIVPKWTVPFSSVQRSMSPESFSSQPIPSVNLFLQVEANIIFL
jgi:hypothetical protein